jgi:tetratricopeptide (TPR) repeat protein
MKNSSEDVKIINKRPISIILFSLLGTLFVLILLIVHFTSIDMIDFFYGLLTSLLFFCIPLILISVSLLLVNLKSKNKKRALGFAISGGAFIFIMILSFLGGSFFKQSFQRAEDLFASKQYLTAAGYYEKVIKHGKIVDEVTNAKSRIEEIKIEIQKANSYEENGDLYFENNLFGPALEEYEKAFQTSPFLGDIKNKIKNTESNLKIKDVEDNSDFVILSPDLEFSYSSEFALFWGSVSVSNPLLCEFENIGAEKGKFFLGNNEVKISGQIKGNPEIIKYVKSDNGLFIFLSAFIIDKNGNLIWNKDGYIEGNTPYIKSGETKNFFLINDFKGNIDSNCVLVIAAYLKKGIILQPKSKNAGGNNIKNEYNAGPNSYKNIIAIYRNSVGLIKEINK